MQSVSAKSKIVNLKSKSDCDFSVSRKRIPTCHYIISFYHLSAIVQGDGWANVIRDSVKHITDFIIIRFGFKDHVLFTMTDRLKLRSVQKEYPFVQRIFRRDRFVPEINADNIISGFRDDACDYQCCMQVVLLL